MTDSLGPDSSPLFDAKEFDEPSVFTPEVLLESTRRQKDLSERSVPDICILDPDGDIVRQLTAIGEARKDETWPGYHTDLYRFERDGEEFGIVGCAVGASFAVLLSEQLFAAGCQFLISVTSSGQIVSKDDPPYFVLIERALRDEGTSHHYRSTSRFATLDDELRSSVEEACKTVSRPVYTGRRGRLTPRFGKQRRRLNVPDQKESLPLRWRQRRCIRSPRFESGQSFASRT